MATDRHRLSIERHLGREQGEALDRRLRDAERVEREERLSRILWGRDGWCGEEVPEPFHRATALDVLELKRQVERLTHYYDSVQSSRAWRLTQFLRRLVGRAW